MASINSTIAIKGILKFFKILFSFSVYDQTHLKILLFGIKIKVPILKYYRLKKQNPFYKYKAEKMDITKIPPAKGDLRDIQLANMVLLKELDYVCKQNNISYWLDGGTMLGAVRHKGFIPWDDDIDVGMMAEDYDRIIQAFKKSSKDKNIYATYVREEKAPKTCIIKVRHKECPSLFVDIFPFYLYGKSLNTEQQLDKTKEIKQIRKKLLNHVNISTPNEDLIKIHKDIMKKEILQSSVLKNSKDADIVWGIQYNHQWKNWFTNYNVIFPLKPMMFEGYEFSGINNPDAFLTRLYGDYMSYPSKITFGHSVYKRKSRKENNVIKSYANDFTLRGQNVHS